MSWKGEAKRLVVRLSQDPKIKVAMEGIRENTGGQHPQLGMLWQVLTISGRFVAKRRSRAVAEVIDVITFLVTLSLIVKQNVFDRPEVREYFKVTWSKLSGSSKAAAQRVQKTAEKLLLKLKNVRHSN